ncbi:hypothetical protein [Escherichia phage vB_EcoM_EP32a]|nr:hypothetical protein [Escherichia phage vB_EcoM_EP32a]
MGSDYIRKNNSHYRTYQNLSNSLPHTAQN